MNNQITISKNLNLLGKVLSIISYIFLVILILGFVFSSIPAITNSWDNQFSTQPDSYLKTGGMFGAILGSIIALLILIIVPLQFATIHKKFKKFVNNKITYNKFIFNYIICWVIVFLTVFASFFSRNIAVIITVIAVLLIPIIYLTRIHKFTNKNGSAEN